MPSSFVDSPDAPIADNIQQTFLDDLLTSYKQLETSFAMQLLDTFKGFEFRTLWDVEDDFFQFQRTASEIAKGTGNLQGILQLCKSLQNLDTLGAKTVQCFSKFHYTSKIHKWSFDNITNAAVSIIMYECVNTLPSMPASVVYTCVHIMS